MNSERKTNDSKGESTWCRLSSLLKEVEPILNLFEFVYIIIKLGDVLIGL